MLEINLLQIENKEDHLLHMIKLKLQQIKQMLF